MTTLDISKNTKLTALGCDGNKLTTLNVGNNTELVYLNCSNNQLTTLDVNKNIKLERVYCSANQLISLDAGSNSQLTTLDISDNAKLTTLNCSNGKLTTLDVSGNTALKELYCDNNRLAVLDLSSNTALTTLDCHANMLTILNLSNNKELTALNCQGNMLTSLNLTGTGVTEPRANDNTYAINLDESRAFSLSDLPDGFDVTKASNWKGGKLNTQKTILTWNAGVDTVTYSYKCGNNVTVTFTLTVDDGSTGVFFNETNFPDAYFRDYVKGLDDNKNNILDPDESQRVTRILLIEHGITTLKGIEYFPNLTKLNCNSNQLTTLDLSQNTKLEELNCYNNQLTTLNLGDNTKLKKLECYKNRLSTLNVSNNTALETLDCSYNSLSTLNVSNNTALETLNCSNNNLNTLDVSNNTALETLDCSGNGLKTLDVSKNNELTNLYCSYNQLNTLDVSNNTALETLDCSNNGLRTLDVSNNTALESLNCGDNSLTTLDVSNNTTLVNLYCYGNSLTSLDLSNNSKMRSLNCRYNVYKIIPDENGSFDLSTLPGNFDLSKTSNWKGGTVQEGTMILMLEEGAETVTYDYDCGYGRVNFTLMEGGIDINATNFPNENFRLRIQNEKYDKDQNKVLTASEIAAITKLDVRDRGIDNLKGIEYFTSLTELDCSYNQLTTLDVSNLTALETLYCGGNNLTTLDISNLTALKTLNCNNNQLTTLDVSKNTALETFNCNNNNLTKLDVSKNAELFYLDCCDNKLTALNVTNNPRLKVLNCIGNSITALDLSKNTWLSSIACSDNKLTKLDLSKNYSLGFINCNNNKLTTLNIKGLSNVYNLMCYGNQLTTLDVSGCKGLKWFDCSNNKLTTLDVKGMLKLETLDCHYNNLTSLTFSQMADYVGLEKVDCSNNKLTSLDLSEVCGVSNLDCHNNNLTTLKFPEYYLTELNCSNNKLTCLDTDNSNISHLDCSNNELLRLTLASSKLSYLDCSNNNLSSLELTKYNSAKITTMDCSNNNLTSLDFSNSTALTTLNCNNNNLTSLDLSKCAALETLSCTGNVYTMITDENRSYELSALPGNFDVAKAGNWKGGTINDEQTVLTVNDTAGTVTYDYDCGNAHSVTFTLKEMESVALNSTNFPNSIFLAYAKTFDKDGNKKLSPAEIMEVTQMDVSGLNINNFKGIEYFIALDSLDISGNTGITALNLAKNRALTSLDASGCTKLASLTVSFDIVNLNISNTNLNNFDFSSYSKLEALDISGLQMPEYIDIWHFGKLTSFKASGCGIGQISYVSRLKTLDLSNNHLVCLNLYELTPLEYFNAEGNTRNIGTIYNGEYDLTKLKASGLNVDNILEVKGATLDKEAGKLTNIEGTSVTYVYDTKNTTLKEAGSFEVTLIADRNFTVNYEVCTQKDVGGVYCETWEEVLAAMNDKTKDYYVYLYKDVKADKLTFPSATKAKSITLLSKNEGEVKTITTGSASVSIPIDVALENICMESTASKGLTISVSKNLSLYEFSSKSLVLIKGSAKSALEYQGSEDKIITADYRIEGFGSVKLNGSITFHNAVKANNLILNDGSIVYAGADAVTFNTITAKTDTAILYNTKDFIPVTVSGTVTADAPITIGVSADLGMKFSENQTVLTSKSAELSMFKPDEGSILSDSETGYTLGRAGANIMVMKGVFALSYSAGGTDYATTFAKWSDLVNRITYNAKLDKTGAKTTKYTIEVLTDTNIGGALTMPKAGTYESLWIKGKAGTNAKTLTFTGTTVSVTGTTTIDNLILNSVQKNTDKAVDFNFSAGKNVLYLRSVSGRIKDVKSSGDLWLNNITINGNVSANELFVLGTTETATISKTSVTVNKNLTVKESLTFSSEGSLTVKGAFSAGGLASTTSEDKISLVLYQNTKKPAVIGKHGFKSFSKQIKFALVDSEGKPVQLSDNMVIASISCPYTNMLIPCDENTGDFDCYIMKEKNKLVAKPKKDADGNAMKYFEVKINDKTAFYLSADSAIKDINTVGQKTDDIQFIVTQEMFPGVIAKLPLPKAGKYESLTYTSEGGKPVTIQVKGDIALTGNLTIDSNITINQMAENKILKRTMLVPISVNVGKYEFHASSLSYDTTKSVSQLKNVSGKGICSIEGDIIISGKVNVKTFDITGTVTLLDSAAFAGSIRTDGNNATLKYSLSNVKNVKLGMITNVEEGYYGRVYIKIAGLQSGDKIATLTDDYIADSAVIDNSGKWRVVRSKNALVVVEYDKAVILRCQYDITRSYDSYENAVADITRLKKATGNYTVTLPQGNYEWTKLLLPAKGKYNSLEIEAPDTSLIKVKSDITLTGNFAIGQNTTLQKVNADGSVADVFNFTSPKNKQGQPVYTVTITYGGKIVNGRLNGVAF